MKLLKQPSSVFILKLICDCENGEMIYQSSSEKGHLHKCSNSECSKEIEINKQFPSTSVEPMGVVIEDVVIKTKEEEHIVNSLNKESD